MSGAVDDQTTSLPSDEGLHGTSNDSPLPSVSAFTTQSEGETETGEGTEISLGPSPDQTSTMGKQNRLGQVEDLGSDDTSPEEPLPKPRYAPPKKPLSPYQLRRIAGTFGIAVPSLDLPPPSPTLASPLNPMSTFGSSRTSRHSPLLSPYSPHGYTSTRPSPYLLSVIPPVTLLPPTSALTPEQARKREKKWRRGTLMPLQPTLGGMLLCIAREYGLPSTTGLNVYLVLPQSAPFSQKSAAGDDSDDEPDGPRVSSQTWTTLFSTYLIQSSAAGSISRAPTPYQTPIKSSNGSEGSIDSPPSPLTRRTVNGLPSGLKHQSTLSTSTSSSHLSANHLSHSKNDSLSSMAPPNPMSSASTASSQHPIVGTIEFDVVTDEAAWFEDWRSKGGKRRWMKAASGDDEGEGVRELGLVRKLGESGGVEPRFLRDIEAERLAQEAHEAEERAKEEQVSEVVKLLGDQGVSREDLLRSPIQLGWKDGGDGGANHAVKRVQEVLEKRWSGLVMSDQLDDLERIMRRLSPREIRVTSPRYMTPGTAERMAISSTLTPLPSVPERGPLSPLSTQLQTPNFDVSDDENSGSDYGEGESMEESAQRHSTAPTDEGNSYVVEDPVDVDQQQSWPAQSYRTPTLPNSPTAVQHFHRPNFPSPEHTLSPRADPSQQSDVVSPVFSSETMARTQAGEPTKAATPDWVPRRPARPPSPQLPDQSTLSHTLSSGYVDILRSPPNASPTGKTFIGSPKFGLGMNSPEFSSSGAYEDGKRRKSGPLKGLRHQMSGVNLGIKWKQDGKDTSPSQASVPGLASSPSEFGALAEHEEDDGRHNSLPSRVNSGKLASRILPASFGFRKRDETRPASLPHRRNPSHDGPINISEISGPIMSSFRHTRSGSLASNIPESTALPQHARAESADMQSPVQPFVPQTPTTPASPASPTRSVRRKPVPNMKNGQQSASSDSVAMGISLRGQENGVKSSMSLGSMASFVLEDPPRGRKGHGMAV
ncbi:hypothetical protein IAR50_004696 [Cryptococcus sp. DSM 104548]